MGECSILLFRILELGIGEKGGSDGANPSLQLFAVFFGITFLLYYLNTEKEVVNMSTILTLIKALLSLVFTAMLLVGFLSIQRPPLRTDW